MSKVEAQRAMREARYAARNSATGTSRREVGAVVETPVARAAGTPATKPAGVRRSRSDRDRARWPALRAQVHER